MLLDRLLDHVSLEVEPFAVCRVQRGWSLTLPPDHSVNLHFVVAGHGSLTTKLNSLELSPCSLVIVPSGLSHRVSPSGQGGNDLDLNLARKTRIPIGDEIVAGALDEPVDSPDDLDGLRTRDRDIRQYLRTL